MDNVIYLNSYRILLVNEWKRTIFKKLTKRALPIYVKGGDISSINSLLFGVHDPVTTGFITSFARDGYNDFFIDVGANIGLISCQNGKEFSEIHMFEPNPLCQNILDVNIHIAIDDTSKFVLHRYALGIEDKTARLMVPRHNFGGGYIDAKENSYDDKILTEKDGFSQFHLCNYITFDVEVRSAAKEFHEIFTNLLNKGLTKGVIKVDTEGFESVIIQGIAHSLPAEIECYIILESLNKDLAIENIVERFGGRASAYKIVKVKPWKRRWPKWIKLFIVLFKAKISYRLDKNLTGDWKGDIVLHIQAQ